MNSVHTSDLAPHLTPLLAIGLYLNYPRALRLPPAPLRALGLVHNAALMCFSAWTFASLVHIARERGLVFRHGYYFADARFELVMRLFYLSKYYEFGDTFLLYAQGKEPSFLQKFHHVGAVVVWHLNYVYRGDCLGIATICNAFVHTIMYAYYLATLLRVPGARRAKQAITSLQLVQLVVPNFACAYLYFPPAETDFHYRLILVFNAYVFCLIYLFACFYWSSYLAAPVPAGKKDL